MPDTVTFVVPALNEEPNIERSLEAMVAAGAKWFEDYEILVYDDGSTDRTGAIAEEVARRHDRIAVFHNPAPKCLGGVMREGARRARMEYLVWGSSTGSHTLELWDRIFSRKGQADLIIIYPTNSHERPWIRRVVSRTFQSLLNLLFGLRLRYYNNSVLYRAELFRSAAHGTDSYAFQAEVIIKLIKRGCSYIEVPIVDDFSQENRRTNAFKPRNVAGVARFLWRTMRDVYGRPRRP